MHTYFWSRPRHECQYEKIRTIKLRSEQGFLVDHSAKLLFTQLGGSSPAPVNCPAGAKVRTTQHRRLLLGTVSPGWPTLVGAEVDIALEVKLAAEYLSFQFGTALGNSVSGMDKTLCDSVTDRTSWEEVFRVHNKTYGRIRGDVLYVFKCAPKMGNVVSSETCITDLK